MFTTYSASAGSGKTTHLVADYIALCFKTDSRDVSLAHSDTGLFRKILAITFTNNAAAEMKERIVQTLHEFAFKLAEDLSPRAKAIYRMVVEQLCLSKKASQEEIETFMRRESLELLRNILYDYARFSLSTIDSFFQRVIRSAALSLNLNLNYSVQLDLNEFFVLAIDQLLNELSAGTELSDKLLFLLDNSLEDSGNLNVDRELRQVLKILYDNIDKNYDYLQQFRTIAPEQYRKTISFWRARRKALPDVIRAAVKDVAAEGQAHIDNLGFSFNSTTLNKWFEKVMEDPIKYYKIDFEEFINEKTGTYFRKELPADKQMRADAELPAIIDCFNRVRDIQAPLRREYLDIELILANADKLSLLFDLQEKMNEIKTRRNIMILSESNTFVYEHIKGKDMPEIFDRIPFGHFFIDEFQDTSDLQWRDLKPLIVNKALATNGHVTLFGDVKQAIYRFRNGEVELFYNLIDYNRLKQDRDLAVVGPDGYENRQLEYNFRSTAPVVRFNNAFFEKYSHTLGLDDYYGDVKQLLMKEKPGLVEIFMAGGDEPGEELAAKLTADTPRTGQHRDETIEVYIAAHLPDLKPDEQEVLRAVGDALARGYDYGDIAILYSGNDKCTRIANLLLDMGFPVVTERSLVLNASPAVNLIIQTIKYLLQPNDLVAQTTILHGLAKLKCKGEVLPQKLLSLSSSDFHDLMQELYGLDIPSHWISQPLFVLVKNIIQFYQLDQTGDPFIVDFENIVLDYLKNRNGEPAQFLQWWQMLLETDQMFSLTLPSDLNAIKVSTIHKSKGLEYPVVIFPYIKGSNRLHPTWTVTSDNQVAYIPLKKDCIDSSFEDLYREEVRNSRLDELNLLYVAHTRAGDMLYVITAAQGSEEGYGDALLDLIRQQEAGTAAADTDALRFTQDETYPMLYYAGDVGWRKQQTDKPVVVPVVPEIRTSSFTMHSVANIISVEEDDGQRAIGNFIHDFLSVQERFPQSMEEVEMLVATVDEAHRPRLREALRNILGDEELRPCFAPGVKALNETTILDADGTEHRPDRVVFLPDRVMVIDYKTGQEHEGYEQQIETYCGLLRGMGYGNVTGRILYV